MEERFSPRNHQRRGIYLLPNLFTTGALFAGFYAITLAFNQNFEWAAISIFIAMILDGLDGRVARLTHTESAFGGEYDSMADLISFGAAPALMVYIWYLSGMGKIGWVVAFVHTAGAALRLARFNTQMDTADKRYFQGLPSPAAAAILAGFVWFVESHGFAASQTLRSVTLGLTLLTGLLMVSNFRYHSFKNIDFRGRVPFMRAIVVMLAFAAVFINPPLVLFTLFTGYAISGPVLTLKRLSQVRHERKV
jgi:CDP-diacylglycerol--serine O-phosphatidyltransferase